MKIISLVLLVLLSTLSLKAQQPDQWRGLVLDQATPEDAIKVLGKPEKDKPNESLRIFGGVANWLTKKRKEKVFRRLEFSLGKESGVQKAYLSFLDNKLVLMTLDLKSGEVGPNGLSNIYGIEFSPLIGSLALAMFEKDYERNQGKIYPKSYPTVYDLVGISDRSFVSAMVSNSSFGSILGKSMGIPATPNNFPGKVEFVDLVSKSLANRDGADILK